MYYHTAGVADASEAWRDVFPDPDAALANILTRGQFHKIQRNSNQQQHHHVEQQERSWKPRDTRDTGDREFFFKLLIIKIINLPKLVFYNYKIRYLLRFGDRDTGSATRSRVRR